MMLKVPGHVAFREYLDSLNIPVSGISGSGATARIDFLPEATQEQRDIANNARASFDWTPRRIPDVNGLQDAINVSQNFSANPLENSLAQLAIAQFFPLIDKYAISNLPAIQEKWALMKLVQAGAVAQGQPGPFAWLTPQVVTEVEALALEYGVQMVVQ